jgi:hypothetical protein
MAISKIVTNSVDSGVTLTSPTLTTPVINGFTGDTSVINIGSGQIYKDASGNLLVGTTSNGFSNSKSVYIQTSSTGLITVQHPNTETSGAAYLWFTYNGGAIGSIAQNGTTGVSYNTSSDYRLKNTIAPMTGALATVAKLKPCTYKWNVDGSDGQGFIAHELQEVVAGCVTGEKDAVDAEGKPQYQGVDTSFLVATLTAAIQEQQALILALTTRISTLEAK